MYKVMWLRNKGFDVEVFVHDWQNDAEYYTEQLGDTRLDFIYADLLSRPNLLPFRFAGLFLSRPAEVIRLWRKAQEMYGLSRRTVRAWILALPLALSSYEIIHFEYSGLAVRYLDALPLLRPAHLVASCRGSAERIEPIVDTSRAKALRQMFPLLQRVHCVSAEMQRTVQYYGAGSAQVFVNYPAIDVGLFKRKTRYPDKVAGPYVVVSVGRLHWAKGFEYALKAVRRLLDKGIDLEYHVVGDGPARASLIFAKHELGLAQCVHLHGARSALEVRQILEKADIYMLPSLSEGISNTVLEAMAMQLPVIATRVGGMTEAVVDGVQGLMVEPRSSEALADAIEQLVKDLDFRKRAGKAGRERVQACFSLEAQTQRFAQEYRNLAV